MFAAASLMSAVEVADLRGVVRELAADPNVGKPIQWWPSSSRVVDLASGAVTYSGAALSAVAIVGPAKVEPDNGVRTGDLEIVVPGGQTAPAVGDVVLVDAAAPYMVVRMVEPDPIGGMCTRIVVGHAP